MDDIFSKLVVIIITAILLCILPAFYICAYTDINSYLYDNNKLEVILDQITLKGYIKDEDYLYNDNLNIIVERDIYIPDKEEFVPYAFSKNTIIENIKEKNIQKFECGDIVTVIYKKDDSYLSLFLNNLFNLNSYDRNITYSGIVKNECY